MQPLQPARGTQDLLPEAARRHRLVSETARAVGELYGFAEIATPIFEFTEVFARPIGETTDIVAKEMYTFKDRGGEDVTLRPENTAGVVRAVLSNGLIQSTPLKFFYSGPMFRYERPQKGRFRQFHQIGVELIGVAQAQGDIEVIALGSRILDALGVRQRTVLELNTLGDPASRAAYRDALVSYFSAHASQLSEDSLRRLDRNPLRIFDSKDDADQRISAEAPPFAEYLNAASRDFFSRVCDGLDRLGIGYSLNRRLVRGLDYYTHSAFEFVTAELGAQGTVMGGGRYDGLSESLDGPKAPGIGFAIGEDRLILALQSQGETAVEKVQAYVAPLGAGMNVHALKLARELRREGVSADIGDEAFRLKKSFELAEKTGARFMVIVGENEVSAGQFAVKNLASGEQVQVPRAELAKRLRSE